MRQIQLKPEKITHPFQLMAAWFAMLILLDGLLLGIAIKIDRPNWAAGFLVISSVALGLLVMLAVFVMLTKFRPHLQGAKEYSEWLKSESRFRMITISSIDSPQEEPRVINVSTAAKPSIVCPIFIADIPKAGQVIESLSELGFRAEIYKQPDGISAGKDSPSQNEAVWIGSRVPASTVVLAIKAVLTVWPHLKYLHISEDGPGPEELHGELFFGGDTEAAKRYRCLAWTRQELEAIPETITQTKLHALVRKKYA